jgi:hypothetical protein
LLFRLIDIPGEFNDILIVENQNGRTMDAARQTQTYPKLVRFHQ